MSESTTTPETGNAAVRGAEGQESASGTRQAPARRSLLEITDEIRAQVHAQCNQRAHGCPCVCGCETVISCDCWGGPDALCTDCDLRVMRGDDQHGGPESAAGRLQAENAELRAALARQTAALEAIHRLVQREYHLNGLALEVHELADAARRGGEAG